METLTAFFGWCTLINLVIYALSTIGVALFRGLVQRMNAKMFGISEDDAARATFQYVANYKLAIIVLCFVPYVALRLMA